jgi:hypothetical protein
MRYWGIDEAKEALECQKVFVANAVESMQDGLLDSPTMLPANVEAK